MFKVFLDNFRSVNIKIYFGFNFTKNNTDNTYYYESNETYIHPKYDSDNNDYDMALVKINKPVTITDEVNNICLPQNWISKNQSSFDEEYVNMGGWGGPTQMLKIAYRKIVDIKITSLIVYVYSIDKLDTCPVCICRNNVRWFQLAFQIAG